jgi:hypothetical protein
MPCQAAEQFGILRHAVHVRLEESKAFFECGELLKEPFLSELPFRAIVFAFISSVDCFLHEVLLAASATQGPIASESDCSLVIIVCCIGCFAMR